MTLRFLMALAVSTGLAGTAVAAPVTDDGGFVNPFTYDFSEPPSVFSAGPENFNAGPVGVVYTSLSSSSVYNFTGGYGLTTNGSWNSGREGYLGTNCGGAQCTISLTFDTLLAGIGGFVNYSRGDGAPATMQIFDASGGLLETFDVSNAAPIVTPNTTNDGAFRGFLRPTTDIARLDIFGEYIVFDDLQIVTDAARVPVPATLPLLLGALLTAGAVARRRRC